MPQVAVPISNPVYLPLDEAIRREIIEAIESDGAHSDQYDIDSIADRVLGGHKEGYGPYCRH